MIKKLILKLIGHKCEPSLPRQWAVITTVEYHVYHDMRDFVPVMNYPRGAQPLKGEVGMFRGVRLLLEQESNKMMLDEWWK